MPVSRPLRDVTLAVAAVVLLACGGGSAPATDAPLLTADAFAAELAAGRPEGATPLLVVDLRAPARYEEGHIPGAISHPWPESRERVIRELDRSREVVLVDDDGTVSAEVAAALTADGFPRVRHVAGGMARWRGPLERRS